MPDRAAPSDAARRRPAGPAASATAAVAAPGVIDRVERALDDALARVTRPARIAVALSGGLDSMVLLDALARWCAASRATGAPSSCLAIHVHHGLSPAADAWQRHCQEACAARGVAFAHERVRVGDGAGQGIEAAARRARYAALERAARGAGANALLLAQHADDQAETVLLQLLRGAGLPGISAMPASRTLGAAATSVAALPLLRPFLDLPRDALETYAARRAVRWVEDASNRDVRHRRNALRHDVLPAIAAHFPDYRHALARSARHAAAAQALCDELARTDLLACAAASVADVAGALPGVPVLARAALRALSHGRLANVLRFWTRGAGLPAASEARLDEMIRQLCEAPAAGRDAGAPARIEIAHGHHRLVGYRDRLFWTAAAPAARIPPALRATLAECRYTGQATWPLPAWHGELRFELIPASGAGDQADTPAPEAPDARRGRDGAARSAIVLPVARLRTAVLSARARAGGERLRLGPGRPSRSLKQLFQHAGIAPAQRDLPLFHLDGRLFFVPLLGGSMPEAPSVATDTSPSILLRWIPWDNAG